MNENTTVAEVQKEVTKTEQDVYNLIRGLEEKTGLKVQNIWISQPMKALNHEKAISDKEPQLIIELENPFFKKHNRGYAMVG